MGINVRIIKVYFTQFNLVIPQSVTSHIQNVTHSVLESSLGGTGNYFRHYALEKVWNTSRPRG